MTDTGTTTYPINTADDSKFKTTSAGAADEGKIPLLDSAGKLNSGFNPETTYSGDGSDGVLDITSGTTTLNAGYKNILTKNYTSINIATGAELNLGNVPATGTLLILKSQGNVTIAGSINLKGLGAEKARTAFSTLDGLVHFGGDGSDGNYPYNGTGGVGGLEYQSKGFYITPNENNLYRGITVVECGNGGGSGGEGGDEYGTSGIGGIGGSGGGALLINCGGALSFTGSIDLDGENGTDGGDAGYRGSGGGGGAGGSAGMALILYKTLTLNTGTITAKGGAGGAGGNGHPYGDDGVGGSGGGSGASYSNAGHDGGQGTTGNAIGGINAISSEGASGGAGGRVSPSSPPRAGASGGAQGISDSDMYLVAENKLLI